ncbi:HEAT repeat domain-containing protein [Proteiniphilum sp. X52]|uniref:HEAT repeat domain-containing protein n=1 Tax=Proteiniphilum sp. X52 TaxID=2382159 RepID=UPI0011CD453F|nr:HEAT repeat domain-containing protein [Proteiniphilum sp. X52]
MKKIAIFLCCILQCSLFLLPAAERVIPAGGKFDTRFLIVIDSKSFEQASAEVMAYKNVLEEQGLGVVVMVGDWKSPDDLRREIEKVYRKKPVMEGAVFIGDIPVVRVRNFQHATTAFKMNEETFPIEESSVTSDRFYDDLDLRFEFLSVDEKNPRHFYYRLREDSPQVIESDFYSARMLPPSDMGTDVYELLRKYLRKVVEAHKEVNYADNIKFFNGHGYNSDCLTVWHNQQFVLKEQFPEAFRSSRGNAFYNFRQDPFMKYNLFERLQMPGTDLFVFHEHGAFDIQYINGDYPAPNAIGMRKEGIYGPMEVLSISLRNRYRRYTGERGESFAETTIREYNLSPDFYSGKLIDSTRVNDSIFSADINIALSDLRNLKPQPRITIFDACYNGSFHQPGYVAGYHIFSDGNTVVAQGNTVNVLQDKWSMELIGMIAEGARIGFWQKEFQFLESHLIGDPTFRLTPGSAAGDRSREAAVLNRNLALNKGNNKIWLEYLKSGNPNCQAIALKQLSTNKPGNYDDILLRYLKESPFYSVRMQALQRIIYSSGRNLTQALLLALDDPYELIRRNGARFAGYSGDEELIGPLVQTLLFSNESQRVQYAARNSLPMFDLEKISSEITRQAAASHLQNPSDAAAQAISYFSAQKARNDKLLTVIQDKTAEQSDRISAIRFLRNHNNHLQVTQLLEILKDDSDDTEVRVVLAEALGWFRWSVKREQIVEALKTIRKDKQTPKKLRDKIGQSILRLK